MVKLTKPLPADAQNLANELSAASPRFFAEYEHFRTMLTEFAYGDEYKDKPSESRPAFCGYVAPVVTAALRANGYSQCKTMRGLRGKSEKAEHVWTNVTLPSGEYVVDATHWQFGDRRCDGLFLVFPAAELEKRDFWNIEPYVELDEYLQDVKPRQREPIRTALSRLSKTLAADKNVNIR
jgi:hypothetical protein